MNALWHFPELQYLGWTLLHSLWQGAVLFGLAAFLLHLLRHKSPHVRYILACCALFAIVVSAVGTYAYLAHSATTTVQEYTVQVTAIALPTEAVVPDTMLSVLIRWLPLGWMVGVFIFSTRLLGGWYWLFHGIRSGATPAPSVWQWKLSNLVRRMGGKRRLISLLVSNKVKAPLAVGWLKPAVLLPASALVHLSPDALEAILAHELAHIMRHDFVVNLMQSIVEVLFFYHPATWWLSGQIRELREHCCDDVAVRHCGNPLSYASALANLETLRAESATPQLALAANGATLMKRIQRLLNVAEPTSSGIRAGLMATIIVSVIGAGTLWGLSNDMQKKQERQRIVVRDGNSTLNVQMQGEIKLDPLSKDGLSLGESASIQISTKENDTTRRLSLRRDGDEIKKTYRENGQEKQMDWEGEAWLGRQIQEIEKVEARKTSLRVSDNDKMEFQITEDGQDGKDSKVIIYSNKSPLFIVGRPGELDGSIFLRTGIDPAEHRLQAEILRERIKGIEFPKYTKEEIEKLFSEIYNGEFFDIPMKDIQKQLKDLKIDDLVSGSVKLKIDAEEIKKQIDQRREDWDKNKKKIEIEVMEEARRQAEQLSLLEQRLSVDLIGRDNIYSDQERENQINRLREEISKITGNPAFVFGRRATTESTEARKQRIEREMEVLKKRLSQLEENLNKIEAK